MTKLGKLLLGIVIIVMLAVAVFFLNKKAPVAMPNPLSQEIVQPPQNGAFQNLGNKDDLVFFSITPELHNDNPSGEPANDKSILIPIVIE